MLGELGSALAVIRSAIREWWNAWVGLTALSLAWLLCALTVVLLPPATFALYRAAEQTVRGRGYAAGELWSFAWRRFGKSWLWLLVNAAVLLGVWLNLAYYARLSGTAGTVLSWLTILVGAAWLLLQCYALPYLMLQGEPRLRLALKNAALTVLASPLFSLIVLGAAAALAYLSFRLPLLLLLGAPALFAVLGVHAVLERLQRFGLEA